MPFVMNVFEPFTIHASPRCTAEVRTFATSLPVFGSVMARAPINSPRTIFGNHRCQYYETLCGGSGAGRLADGRGFPGASAVQTHMTNSRLTDPEVLEFRFPVRLESYAIRAGSGGAASIRAASQPAVPPPTITRCRGAI